MPSRNRKAWKLFVMSLTAALLLPLLAGCGDNNKDKEQKDDSKVVVKYKGGEITEKEFELEQRMLQFVSPESAQFLQMDEFKEYLAKQGVAYEYLSANAGEEAKKTAEAQAEDVIKQYKKQIGAEQFKKMLDTQKLTEQDFKNYMLRVMTVVEDQKIKVSEDDVKKTFEKNKQDFTLVTVRHVLIGFTDTEGKERKKEDALKIANEVKSKLEKGEDFAAVAKEYSEDPGSKDKGGLYEKQEAGTWVPEFKEKALTLEKDKISEPVETSYGYHVLKVEDRQEMTFDKLAKESKDRIKSELAADQIDQFMKTDLPKIIEKMDLPKSNPPAAPAEQNDNKGTGK